MTKWDKERQKRRENSRPMLKRQCAAFLLRLFRGQHGEKMVCTLGMPAVTATILPNNYFDPTQTGWETATPP